MMDDNDATWLAIEALKLGTDDQRERWEAGLLPDAELARLARAELFRGFASFPRKAKLSHAEVWHLVHRNKACSNGGEATDITFTVGALEELTGEQWSGMNAIYSIAQALETHPWVDKGHCKVIVDVRAHWAHCRACGRGNRYPAALVTVDGWAGRSLSREYLLTRQFPAKQES